MRRVYAVAIALALLVATPGSAAADTSVWPGTRQQAIQHVIARALSQRGVPYAYGGGNASGPSLGTPASTPTVEPSPGVSTLTLPGVLPLPEPEPVAKTVGFDSSGLIVYAFAGVGIKMPRSSGEQYKVGRKILPSQALPGDLIFFGEEGAQSVALFVGNNQMIEATDPVVAVSPVRTATMTPYLTRIIDP
jgi:cell wall-associated NlpC family hydrolase